MGLLTDRFTNKSEKSNLINARAPSREPVPLNKASRHSCPLYRKPSAPFCKRSNQACTSLQLSFGMHWKRFNQQHNNSGICFYLLLYSFGKREKKYAAKYQYHASIVPKTPTVVLCSQLYVDIMFIHYAEHSSATISTFRMSFEVIEVIIYGLRLSLILACLWRFFSGFAIFFANNNNH